MFQLSFSVFFVRSVYDVQLFIRLINNIFDVAGPGSSVGCTSAWHADSPGFDPRVMQHSFMETGHEIISTAILYLPLIQVGQLSVTGQRMCTQYWLTT